MPCLPFLVSAQMHSKHEHRAKMWARGLLPKCNVGLGSKIRLDLNVRKETMHVEGALGVSDLWNGQHLQEILHQQHPICHSSRC